MYSDGEESTLSSETSDSQSDDLFSSLKPTGTIFDQSDEEMLGKISKVESKKSVIKDKWEIESYQLMKQRLRLHETEKNALAELLKSTEELNCKISNAGFFRSPHVLSLSISGDQWVQERSQIMTSANGKQLQKLESLEGLFLRNFFFKHPAFESIGKLKKLRVLSLSKRILDEDIAKLQNLNTIECLEFTDDDIGGNGYLITGEFLQKLSKDARLRIFRVGDVPIELRYLEHLADLKNLSYIEVRPAVYKAGMPFGKIRVPKEEIRNYVEKCRNAGLTTASALERVYPAGHKAEIEKRNITFLRLSRLKKSVRISETFDDKMVLQRGIPTPVWGNAEPNAEVTVTFAEQTKTTTADSQGNWMLKLDPLEASSTGRLLTASSKGVSAEIKDVLVGEVWIFFGDGDYVSDGPLNKISPFFTDTERERRMRRSSRKEKQSIDFTVPQLRVLRAVTWKIRKFEPLDTWERWQECSKEELVYFGIVPFLFGKEVREKLNVPVGLIQLPFGMRYLLEWAPMSGIEKVPAHRNLLQPSAYRFDSLGLSIYYDWIIKPRIPLGFRGVFSFHRDSGEIKGGTYDADMEAIIRGWRTEWKQGDFPFYFAQVPAQIRASWASAKRSKDVEYLKHPPRLWGQQVSLLTLPNVGLTTISDLIRLSHYEMNRGVASRLARLALSRTYGFKFPDDCGPLLKDIKLIEDGKKAVVEFSHANSGLTTLDGKPPDYFEVAGADGVFWPAIALIKGNTVELRSPKVDKVSRVQFGWHRIAMPNLCNGEKLPAMPFQWPPQPANPNKPEKP
jgi:sialate O-acetylesterase